MGYFEFWHAAGSQWKKGWLCATLPLRVCRHTLDVFFSFIYGVHNIHPSISCPGFSLTRGHMNAVTFSSCLEPLFHRPKNPNFVSVWKAHRLHHPASNNPCKRPELNLALVFYLLNMVTLSVSCPRSWYHSSWGLEIVHCAVFYLPMAHAQNRPDAGMIATRRDTTILRLFAEQFHGQKCPTTKQTGHLQTRFHAAPHCLLSWILSHVINLILALWRKQTLLWKWRPCS